MTSAYQINDVLPKDSGGQKFLGLAEPGSVTSFTLLRSVGASNADSKKYGWQAVATHEMNGEFGASPGFVVGGGLWLETPTASPIATSGRPRYFSVSQHGELNVNTIRKSIAYSTASTQTHISASGGLHTVFVSWTDINAGNNIIIKDGGNDIINYPFPTASGAEMIVNQQLAALPITTSIKHVATLGTNAAASITILYTTW